MASYNDHPIPPEPFGQPPRTGRFWFDLLAVGTALFISVVSLVVAFRGEQTQRGLLAANSWPFVQLSEDIGTDDAKLDVENAGVGPAKVMTFEIFYRGTPVGNVDDLLHRCCGLAVTPQGSHAASLRGVGYGQVYGNVLRPGEHIIALSLGKSAPPELLTQFKAAMGDLSYLSCYCSVLQECWRSDLRSLTQNAVISCPVLADPYAMQN